MVQFVCDDEGSTTTITVEPSEEFAPDQYLYLKITGVLGKALAPDVHVEVNLNREEAALLARALLLSLSQMPEEA